MFVHELSRKVQEKEAHAKAQRRKEKYSISSLRLCVFA
jgi:hypothetical protein